MRKLLSMMVVAVLAAGFTLAYSAEEKTITGMAQCAKCALKEAKSCQNVIVVKEDGRDVNYFLVQNEVAKKAHQKLGFCNAPKGDGPTVRATGEVKEEEGKHMMTASKIEAVEEE
jgi:hypothetical protein